MSCSEIAMSFLLSWGLHLTAPTVEVVPTLAKPGFYVDGVVFIREDVQKDCGVWVHEFVHAWQDQRGDWDKTSEGYFRREAEAHKIELSFRGRE